MLISCDEWVALKILAAHSDEEKSAKEIGILRELCVDPGSNDEVYVVRLLDDFFHEGPNGRHQCLVLELLGPSLDSVIKSCNPPPFLQEQKTADDSIDPQVIFRVSKKLLGALDTLHAKGIAHGGTALSQSTFNHVKTRKFDIQPQTSNHSAHF